MRKVEIQTKTHLEIDGIEGFFIRKVTKFGNSAKVDCPKDFLGRTAYLVIILQSIQTGTFELSKRLIRSLIEHWI